MTLGASQTIGVAVVAAIIAAELVFLRYVTPRVNAIFRRSLKAVINWSIIILIAQALFLIVGASS